MILTNDLCGCIAKAGLSQAQVAREIGITPKTFYLKMKKGVFNSDEIYLMIHLLHMENPMTVFFAEPKEKGENHNGNWAKNIQTRRRTC